MWQHGDGDLVIGHQELVDHLRDSGYQGVIIADGMSVGSTFAGSQDFLLADPLKSGPAIVYAVHPYFYPWAKSEKDWQENWGFLAATQTVWANEWFAGTAEWAVACKNTRAETAVSLLSYLQQHHIGLGAFAIDSPYTLTTELPGVSGNQLTTLPPGVKRCTDSLPWYSTGALTFEYYQVTGVWP